LGLIGGLGDCELAGFAIPLNEFITFEWSESFVFTSFQKKKVLRIAKKMSADQEIFVIRCSGDEQASNLLQRRQIRTGVKLLF
jgi:hypothetical protein